MLSKQDLEKLVDTFITNRLDYCNELLKSLSKSAIRQLQLIQNTTEDLRGFQQEAKKAEQLQSSDHCTGYEFLIESISKYCYLSINH